MKAWQKAGIGVAVAALAGGIVWYSVNQANKDVVTVQTAKVGQEHLTTVVTSSGQVTPKTYSNILAQGYGQITDITVKEGDQVKRGDILLKIDSIQPKADAEAQEYGIVNDIFEREGFMENIMEYARQFTPPNKAAKAVGRIKRAVQTGWEIPMESALAVERENQQILFQSEDAKEGLAAYVEKRPAVFKAK